MGAKLTLLWIWTPKTVIKTELAKVDHATTNALLETIKTYAPNTEIKANFSRSGSVEERRQQMAKTHVTLVEALVNAVGEERAVQLGRDALFAACTKLGQETRRRLCVKTQADIVKASKVIYRVLCIDATLTWQNTEVATLTVHRCALAQEYTELTCQVLSAADEGVFNGLRPKATMAFSEKLTGGCQKCVAALKFRGDEK
jgi:hypothetical protein